MKESILNDVILGLDYNNGELLDSSFSPNNDNKVHWLDKGDWLRSAAQAGIQKLFFVENNPTVVFAKSGSSSTAKNEAFNKIWCLAGPRILFLETDGELSIVDLAQKPIRAKQSQTEEFKTLERLNLTQNYLEKLQRFHRNNIETGRVFQEVQFGDINQRADRSLISDLRYIRNELINDNLSESYAHSLIGRSIFIRYLEDRKILTDEYFNKIARGNNDWKEILSNSVLDENLDFSNIQSKYLQVLQDKDFTYALFRKLSQDFNGDMFPNIDAEEKNVKIKHLKNLRNMLQGNTEAQLFFYSYKFDIIPLNLISAIYEEFYQSSGKEKNKKSIDEKQSIIKKSRARQEGAFYTPPSLVEFVLSRVLTKEIIKQKPKILDPACGSGIFLVEAFRRIVRYSYSKGNKLSFNNLKDILKNQIVGIEINEEAARITAFSLYLALLNYLDPPSIQEHIKQGNRLPNLLVTRKNSSNHLNIIYNKNAFNLDKEIIDKVDIVVGNPPWGSPGKKNLSKEMKNQIKDMFTWCSEKKYTIGDEDQSQAFLLYAMEILNKNGYCAMLVSSASLLSHKAINFRLSLVSNVSLTEVFNFSFVRKLFFNGAISPFFLVQFNKIKRDDSSVIYWSPKQIRYIANTQSIVLSKYDRAFLVNQNLANNKTWKVNWFGRHADVDFISQLGYFNKLENIIDRDNSGQGYAKTPSLHVFPDVSNLETLNLSSFDKYSSFSTSKSPKKFYKKGVYSAYIGSRLLIKKGISTEKKDFIISRYETKSFCFTNTINGIKLKDNDENLYFLILGILWSLFSKYYYFNISAKWGIWHEEIYLDEELLQLPIPDKLSGRCADNIISLVKKLREYKPQIKDLLHPNGIPEDKVIEQRKEWEIQLDEFVLDLYEFTNHQKILINDFYNVTLPFLYNPYNSKGVEPVIKNDNTKWVTDYAICFNEYWQPYLEKDETLRADLCIALSNNVIAIEFFIADFDDEWDLSPKNKIWESLLSKIDESNMIPLGTSRILLEGVVHIDLDKSIIIIKRNEKRFWTKSLAYEDAESIMAKRIIGSNTITENAK